MTDFKPVYESDLIKIFEYPQPICAIVDKNRGVVDIRTPEDAKAAISSLISFLNAIPFEFGGYGEPETKTTQEIDKLHPSWNDPDRGWI